MLTAFASQSLAQDVFTEVTGATPVRAMEWNAAEPMDFFESLALTTAYSNRTTYLARALTQGPAATISGNAISRLLADDIVLAGGTSTQRLGRIYWTTFNGNAEAVSARMRLRFWRNDSTTNLPGSYYATGSPTPGALGVTFNPVSFTANAANVWFFDVGNSAGFEQWFSANAGETIWMGVTFDNNVGATGATEAQIGNMGQLLFDPPTVGTTPDGVFITNSAGNFFAPNSPAGARVFWTGTNPPPTTNLGFGWEYGQRVRIFGRVDYTPGTFPADGRTVTVELRSAGADPTTAALDTWTGVLAGGGRFDFDAGAGVTTGASYDVYVKDTQHLKEKGAAPITINALGIGGAAVDGLGAPVLVVAQPRNGDINNSNVIDLDDFLILASTYEQSPPSVAEADLTGDGEVNLDDFLILASNYEQVGEGGPI